MLRAVIQEEPQDNNNKYRTPSNIKNSSARPDTAQRWQRNQIFPLFIQPSSQITQFTATSKTTSHTPSDMAHNPGAQLLWWRRTGTVEDYTSTSWRTTEIPANLCCSYLGVIHTNRRKKKKKSKKRIFSSVWTSVLHFPVLDPPKSACNSAV